MLAEVNTATPDLIARGAYPHWRTDVIRFADLDPIGHVNNVAYLTYVESGRVMFFSDLGQDVADSNFAWMTVRLEINYLQQMSLPGTIEVGTGVLDVGCSSVRLSHAIFSDDRCAAQCECVMVMVARSDNRAYPVPAELRTALMAMSCRA